MQKEILTREHITKDLLAAEAKRVSRETDQNFGGIVSWVLVTVAVGFLTRRIWLCVIPSLFVVYHVIRYAQKIHASRVRKQAIREGAFTVTIEKLSHVSEETVHEIRSNHRGRTSRLTIVDCLYFPCGRWRVPEIYKHYAWSKEYYLSTDGLLNTSVAGDEFYVVTDNVHHEIGYVYNTELFDLKDQ